MTTDQARTVGIQCVAELGHGVAFLDDEITGGAPRREVLRTMAAMRKVLQLLEDTVYRDGRPL